MANNPSLFNAALAGATGGAQARWLTDPVSGNYAAFRAAAIALATAVDAAIPAISGGASAGDDLLILAICQGVTAGRLISSSTSGDYADIAAAVAALFSENRGGLTPAPAVPLNGLYKDTGSVALDPAPAGAAIITLEAIAVAIGDTYMLTWGGDVTWDLADGDQLFISLDVLQPGQVVWEAGKGASFQRLPVGSASQGEQSVSLTALGIATAAGDIQFRLSYTLVSALSSAINNVTTLAAVQVGNATLSA